MANLEKISGHASWKINQKNGLVAWLEIPDAVEAERIKKVLLNTRAMKVSISLRQDNKIPVIKCEEIYYEKLNYLAKLPSASSTLNVRLN